MICKYCNAFYEGDKCPACGKKASLMKRSEELDRLMSRGTQEPAIPSPYEQGLKEGYQKGIGVGHQKGLKDGYEKGVGDGYQQGVKDGYAKGFGAGRASGAAALPPQKNTQKWIVLCAAAFLIGGIVVGLIGSKVGYDRGFQGGKEAALDEERNDESFSKGEGEDAKEATPTDLKGYHEDESQKQTANGSIEEKKDSTVSGTKSDSNSNNAVVTLIRYDKGKTRLSWDVNGTAPASYCVYAQIINRGKTPQERIKLGSTDNTELETDQLIPGYSYAITVCDGSGAPFGTTKVRMRGAQVFENKEKVKSSAKIVKNGNQRNDGNPSAKEIEEGLASGVEYGVEYQIDMAIPNKDSFFLTFVFESPEGFMCVDDAKEVTFTWHGNNYSKTLLIGNHFFQRLKDTVGSISEGTYSIYLFINGEFAIKKSFRIEK